VEAMSTHPDRHPPLFNSPLETGLRALVILEAFHPRPCGVTEMTWFDHLVVHTADLDGLDGADAPESLHPDLPARTGELLVRRSLVEESLRLMQRVHLVDAVPSDDGIHFVASEEAPSFLDLLQAPYTRELKHRARWIAERFAARPSDEIKALVADRIGRWTAEFHAPEAAGTARDDGP